MIYLESFYKFSYYSNFETRSLNVLDCVESFIIFEPSTIIENWRRFNNLSGVNFIVNSHLVPCILSSVNVKSMGVIKPFFDHLNLTWEHVKNISSRPLTNITKGPQYAVTRNFANSVQAALVFRYCLSPYFFIIHIITSYMGLLTKKPWFTFAHTEVSGGASFALSNKGIKVWCVCTSSTGTRFFERCCGFPEVFIELTQRCPHERDTRFLQFTLQRPGDLIYISHLLAHAVLIFDTDSPMILSR